MRVGRASVVRAAIVCLLFAAAGIASAQQAPAAPAGQPTSDRPLRDREFGVTTRQFGLQRKVEMYQWRRHGRGYRKVWEARPIDSSAHDEAYRNPGAFPLQTRYWIATRVTLDGKPLDEDVLKALGRWRDFRPGFSALPGNLAATFQPEGNGLGSAENPLDPQVGDLRVTWRELTLPPVEGRVALRGGMWTLKPDAVASAQSDATSATIDAAATQQGLAIDARTLAIASGAVLLVLAVVLLRRRRRRSMR